MRRQIKQKNRCASHQKRSIVRPMLSVMAIQIALTAEELGKIVSAGIPSIGTRKAIYQLTVYFAKETVAFCMFLLAQPACGTPRQSIPICVSRPAMTAQPACGTPRQRDRRMSDINYHLGTTCVRYAEAKVEVAIHEPPPTGTTCVWYATKASKKTGLARLFGYIRNFVRKPTVFSIWLL